MYRDHTQVERIKIKSDPYYGFSQIINIYADKGGINRIKLNEAIVETIG